MKSAYEIALERLAEQGIEKPREGELSKEVRERMAEERRKASASLAELEILHRDRLAKLADPAAVREEEDDYQRERRRLEDRRDRAIEKLRREH